MTGSQRSQPVVLLACKVKQSQAERRALPWQNDFLHYTTSCKLANRIPRHNFTTAHFFKKMHSNFAGFSSSLKINKAYCCNHQKLKFGGFWSSRDWQKLLHRQIEIIARSKVLPLRQLKLHFIAVWIRRKKPSGMFSRWSLSLWKSINVNQICRARTIAITVKLMTNIVLCPKKSSNALTFHVNCWASRESQFVG